jgi:GAF domain-containing protein
MSNQPSQEQRHLAEISSWLSGPIGGQPLPEILQVISERLLGIFAVDHSTITLLDDRREYFRVEGESPEQRRRLIGERIRIQDRPAQLALLHDQKPVLANDLDDEHPLIAESPSFARIAKELDIRSLIVVPMVLDGKTIGTISLDTIGRSRHFTTADVDLAQALARQVAMFVEIARLREERERYQRQAELVAQPPSRNKRLSREQDVGQTLFEELEKLLEFKKASLQIILDGKRVHVATTGFDSSVVNPWLLRAVDADPLIRKIVSTKKPLIIGNTTSYKDWVAQPETADVKSWIGIPLMYGDEAIGILTLDHDRTDRYASIAEDVLARLEDMAVKAAQDLWAARELEVAQRQVNALAIVQQFSETVMTKLDPEDVLRGTVAEIKKGLDCTRCSLFLAESTDKGENLCLKMESPIPNAGYELPGPHEDRCPVYRAFVNSMPLLIHDQQQQEGCPDDCSLEFCRGARSLLMVPLRSATQTMGMVLAVHDKPGWFGRPDELLLETLARQAASTIERATGLELVHKIGNKMIGATAVKVVLEDVVSGAMNLIHADSGVIYELNEDCTEVIDSYKPAGSVHPQPRLSDPNGITRTVARKMEMIVIRDVDDDGRVNPQLRGRYRSMIAVPLVLNESVIGVLYLNGTKVREPTKPERTLLDTLAGQAALAIQRARLYRKSIEKYDWLLGEMHHRVRRSYAEVNGVLELQEDVTDNPEALRVFRSLRDRIFAMANVHKILHETHEESNVNMDDYFGRLSESLISAYFPSKPDIVETSASGICLNEKAATKCGLIVTELVANSLLHAFPEGIPDIRKAKVKVSLVSTGDRLRLTVADNGIGMPAATIGGNARSMGLSLVQSLVSNDLKGTLDRMSNHGQGTNYAIVFGHQPRREPQHKWQANAS